MSRRRRDAAGLVLLLALALGACRRTPPPREYQVIGQIVRIDRATNHVTIRHEDIKGFMPAMTMPFPVRDANLLAGREPGDLVEATLLVQDTAAWIGSLRKTGHAALPEAGEAPVPGLAPGDHVPDQTFTDQDGAPLGLDWLDGHVAVVTFVYTRCPLPDFCPAIDSRFAQLQGLIESSGDSGGSGGSLADVRLLSVTIDPAYDTPAVLKAHAAKRGADPAIWRFATTGVEQLPAFGRQFGLDVRRAGSGPADIEHNLRTIVLGRDRRIVEMLTGASWNATELAARLRTVAGA
jgi:protein SCO1/2